MHVNIVEVTDGVIRLQPFLVQYAEAHLAGEDDAQVTWLSGGTGTLQGVRRWIERNQEHWENDGPIFNFAIFTANDELIGMIEANGDRESLVGLDHGDANISYGLYPFARGQGYATRAVNLMMGFLCEKGYRRAVIRVAPGNAASLKVPIRCGFTEDGTVTSLHGDTFVRFVKIVS